MDFGSLGEKKKAIFCVIPVDDSSMNYLVGMLYTQCFQALYRRADEKHNGRLPVPVRVIQDEWANVAQPESYPKILATCRSYNIGLNIIVQNIQQIKALYEKEWESIIGNCDTLLFLGGGNEPTSLEFIVKLLGKETIATRTRGQTKGRSGSSSTNFQQTGRDLMTIDEVRKLDTHKAILFIRGEDPVLDKKYNIKRHPNIKLTIDGTMQHSYCTDISWEDARPGDLVFYPDNSHVGIVGGRDANGELLIIHCASGYNNVVITGKEGFASIGRPQYYSD